MKRIALTLAVASLLTAGLLPNVRATPPEGPVTIVMTIDLSSPPPSVAVFEVIEGADIVGCTTGTALNYSPPGMVPHGQSAIVRAEFYCGRLPDGGEPDFITIANGNPTVPGPGDLNGQWVFWKGTGEYDNLRGGGKISGFLDFQNGQLIVISTGVAHRDP